MMNIQLSTWTLDWVNDIAYLADWNRITGEGNPTWISCIGFIPTWDARVGDSSTAKETSNESVHFFPFCVWLFWFSHGNTRIVRRCVSGMLLWYRHAFQHFFFVSLIPAAGDACLWENERQKYIHLSINVLRTMKYSLLWSKRTGNENGIRKIYLSECSVCRWPSSRCPREWAIHCEGKNVWCWNSILPSLFTLCILHWGSEQWCFKCSSIGALLFHGTRSDAPFASLVSIGLRILLTSLVTQHYCDPWETTINAILSSHLFPTIFLEMRYL